jgi:hypothetical protein
MNQTFTILLCALIVMVTSIIADGQSRSNEDTATVPLVSESPSRVRPLVRKVLYPVADELNLSDDQQRRIEEIAMNRALQTEPLMKEVAANNKRLRSLFVDPAADREEIIKLATQQGEAIANLTILYEDLRLEIFHVLTPAQQNLVRKHIEEADSGVAKAISVTPVDEQ